MNNQESYQTIRVRYEDDICYLQLYRPEANNTVNDVLIMECGRVLQECEEKAKIVILEGLPDVFCFGADFQVIADEGSETNQNEQGPGPLYDLWLQLAKGPYITVAHVRGKTNAGGIGFVTASDIVLADSRSEFSLSELLFGLMPACVLPFLIRRIGFQKAHYMTLMTKPVDVETAEKWGLVDAYEENSASLLRKHLLRLRRLGKTGIQRYKAYMNTLDNSLKEFKPKAIAANLEVFSDMENRAKISRYVKTGQFPWEN